MKTILPSVKVALLSLGFILTMSSVGLYSSDKIDYLRDIAPRMQLVEGKYQEQAKYIHDSMQSVNSVDINDLYSDANISKDNVNRIINLKKDLTELEDKFNRTIWSAILNRDFLTRARFTKEGYESHQKEYEKLKVVMDHIFNELNEKFLELAI